MKSLLFILNILFFFSCNCFLKIPFKYYPVKTYDSTTPSAIMNNIIQQKIFAILELGTPKQILDAELAFYSNDFYITDEPLSMFIKDTSLYSDLKSYDWSQSTTLQTEEIESTFIGDNFEWAEYNIDKFYFGTKEVIFPFYMIFKPKDPSVAGIGLQLLPYSSINTATPDEKKSFLYQLKEKGIIDEYYWSIFYNNKKYENEDEGFILFGSLPHETESDLGIFQKSRFDSEQIRTTKLNTYQKIVLNEFDFNGILAYREKDKKNKINSLNFNSPNSLHVEIDYHNGGIRASETIRIYLENKVFGESISKEQCFKDIFKIQNNQFEYFYCKNDKNVISAIKKRFPSFSFKSADLNYNFDIIADDVFVEESGYIFCLIYFDKNEKQSWSMGKPFLKKYPFTFNPEKKVVSFYSVINEEKKNENSNITFIIVIVVVTIIVIGVCALIGKLLYDKYIGKKSDNGTNETNEENDYTAADKQNNQDGAIND